MSEVADFDAMYRGESGIKGMDTPPWDIGEPQPIMTALEQSGRVRGPVLDAGCGTGDTSRYLAGLGYTVTGVDGSPTAIATARDRTRRQQLGNAEFVVSDITMFEVAAPRFATVLDSTLYHSLAVSARESYLAAIHRACLPGAWLHILCFSTRAPFPPDQPGPNLLSEQELRDGFGDYWNLDELTPATITSHVPGNAPDSVRHEFDTDEHGRVLLPGWLASAHRND